MKLFVFLLFILISLQVSFSQNVGIGTTNVTKGKLTVIGTANGNSNTVAYFGNAGISLQQNWPTIGFNQYRAIPTGSGYAMATGYGMHMAFNYNNGDFAMLRNGNADAGSALPLQQSFFSFLNGSNALYLNTEIPNGKLYMPGRVFTSNMGNLNLLPIGIIEIRAEVDPNYVNPVATCVNKAGNLATSCELVSAYNNPVYQLYLNPSAVSGYSELIVMHSLVQETGKNSDYSNMSFEPLLAGYNRIDCHINLISNGDGYISYGVRGYLIVYGISN